MTGRNGDGPYLDLDRDAWRSLRASTPMSLTAGELDELPRRRRWKGIEMENQFEMFAAQRNVGDDGCDERSARVAGAKRL